MANLFGKNIKDGIGHKIKKGFGGGLSKEQFDIVVGALICDLDIVKKSLKGDPDSINHSNELGMTPLHISIAKSNFSMAFFLLGQEGIDLFKVDNFGRRPIDLLGDYPNSEFRVSLLKAMYPDRYKKYETPDASLDL